MDSFWHNMQQCLLLATQLKLYTQDKKELIIRMIADIVIAITA
jgi:hypothetical protein